MSNRFTSLFLFAHQDDEFFFFPTIDEQRKLDSIFIFLTDGAFYGDDPERRDNESLNVLNRLGIPSNHIVFLRKDFQVNDTKLVENLDSVFDKLIKVLENQLIQNIYTLGWEGGHPDHDACFLLAIAYAKWKKIDQVLVASLYNAYGRKKPFFNVMKPVKRDIELIIQDIPITRAFYYLYLILYYRTQWKTWLALLPFAAYRVLIQRRVILQIVNVKTKIERPHEGSLYYEMRNWTNFETFLENSKFFREKHQLV